MQLVWDHWHIEASSICTLKCPRCPRMEVPESLLNRYLTLQFFQERIGEDIVKQIKKITFCGNDGDPIYCKDFLQIVQWIKQTNPDLQILLITNGSYKTDDWWHSLGQALNHRDEIHWSLDGWDQASNEQYRVNCDWDSIVSGYKAFANSNSSTFRTMASIAFRFNETDLDRMEQFARDNHFDCFQLTKSAKFGSKYPSYGDDDQLEPTNTDLIATGHRFERSGKLLTDKARPGSDLKLIYSQRAEELATQGEYSGICFIGNKGVFVNSRGEFYPCCWTANRYEHNQSWLDLAESKFNLYNSTFEEILADDFWQTDFLKFDSFECQMKCTPDKLSDVHHTTEW